MHADAHRSGLQGVSDAPVMSRAVVNAPMSVDALGSGTKRKSSRSVRLSGNSIAWRDERLVSLWEQGTLCDIGIDVDGRSFKAHRIVLASSSEFMAALLCDTTRWSDSSGSSLSLPELDPGAFSVILEWMYTGVASSCEDDLPDLLHAAAHLQTGPLQRDIERAAIDLLREGRQDPLLWWTIADALDMGTLRAESKSAALRQFESIAATEAFLQVPQDALVELLEDDRLVVKDERAALDAVLRWTRAHQPAVAHQELLRRIRFPLLLKRPAIDSEIETLIRGVPELRMNPRAKAIIVETFNRYRLEELSHVKRARFDPDQPDRLKVDDGPNLSWFVRRNPHLNWLHFDDAESHEDFKDTLRVVKGLVDGLADEHSELVTSGPSCWSSNSLLHFFYHGKHLSIAFYDLRFATKAWRCIHDSLKVSLPSTVPPLPLTSTHFQTRLGSGPSSIAMIGGDGKSNARDNELSDVVRYNVAQYTKGNSVRLAPLGVRLQAPRSAICAVAVQTHSGSRSRAFYVMGGTHAGRTVDTVECFVEQLGSWHSAPCAPLPERRSKAGAAVIGSMIYVVGGERSTLSLATVAVHDTAKPRDGWHMRAPLQTARVACGVAALGGYVYAIGGCRGSDPLDSVERYNPSTDTWDSCSPYVCIPDTNPSSSPQILATPSPQTLATP